MKNMRVSVTSQEIFDIFKYYQTQKKSLLLWQSVNDVRTKIPCQLFEINAKGDLRFLSVGQTMKFRPEFPIYIYGEHKTLLFKAVSKSMSSIELVVPQPKLVRFEEMRAIKRYDLNEFKNCEVGFSKILGAVGSNNPQNFSSKIFDLSESGISFLMHPDSGLKLGSEIQINQIQNDKIGYNLNGKVVHLTAKTNSKGIMDIKQAKVGVKFKQTLKLKDLYIFKKVIKDLA